VSEWKIEEPVKPKIHVDYGRCR